MNKIKIFTDGARGYSCQQNRIDQGFWSLGHELTPYSHEADLIYSNNPSDSWDQIIKDKKAGALKKGVKIIFNILDLCPHCTDFPILKLMRQTREADAVTVISHTVAQDCMARLHKNIDYPVIFQPQMPVSYNPNLKKHPYKYLVVGRACDGNKRIVPALYALQFLGVKEDEVGIVGSEYPGWGTRLGVVTSEYLNELYNSADFLLMPSLNEGIGLGAIEAASCKVIPVICRDLSTRWEFFPEDIFPEYMNVEATPSSICMFLARFMQDNNAKNLFKESIYQHYKINLEDKFAPINVARRIIEVYNNIK